MSGLFKTVDKDGRVTYSDTPVGAAGSQTRVLGQDGREKPQPAQPPQQTQAQKDYATAKQDIGLARKHIPNVMQYLEYIDYLRHHSPVRFNRVMLDLQQQDPKLWLKLQKFPEFQPLTRALGPSKAGSNLLSLGVGIANGDYVSSFDKWAESSLKDLMKRDSYYADVLGSKATTLPSPPKSTYSNSKLGQYLARETPKLESASKASAKELDAARAELRTGKATSFGRVGGTVLDIEMQMLDSDKAVSIGVYEYRKKVDLFWNKGVLDDDQYQTARQLLSAEKYPELKKLLDDAYAKYVSGK